VRDVRNERWRNHAQLSGGIEAFNLSRLRGWVTQVSGTARLSSGTKKVVTDDETRLQSAVSGN